VLFQLSITSGAAAIALGPLLAMLFYPGRKGFISGILISTLGVVVTCFKAGFINGGAGVIVSAALFILVTYSCRKNSAIPEGLEKKRIRTSSLKVELTRQLASSKDEAEKMHHEHKRSLAVYTAIKTLSEAIDLNAVKIPLENCIKDYTGLESFAFYLQYMHDPQNLHPIVKKNVDNTELGNWERLNQFVSASGKDYDVSFISEGVKQIACVPVMHSNEFVGYFAAFVPKDSGNEKLSVMKAFAEEVAFAIKRVRLFQEVEWLSQIDGLTGVYRRNVLDERLMDETMRAKTFKTTYCLMLMDIDHFKKLNDTYGHQFGDSVLHRIGEILKSSVYETDFVARYGGEEFAVLLPRADSAGVLRKAEAIRSRVEHENFMQGLDTVKVTISIGIAHYPRDGQSPESVISAADAALYAAKERGRNRIVDAF